MLHCFICILLVLDMFSASQVQFKTPFIFCCKIAQLLLIRCLMQQLYLWYVSRFPNVYYICANHLFRTRAGYKNEFMSVFLLSLSLASGFCLYYTLYNVRLLISESVSLHSRLHAFLLYFLSFFYLPYLPLTFLPLCFWPILYRLVYSNWYNLDKSVQRDTMR